MASVRDHLKRNKVLEAFVSRRRDVVLQTGFTLLELLVVLVLLGIMAVLVAPGLGGSLESVKLKTMSRDLLLTFRGQRSEAITQGRIVVFSIDPEGLYYRIDDERIDLPEGLEIFLQRPVNENLGDALSHQQAQGFAANSVAFYPDGSSSGALLQINLGKARRYISIDWLSGEVVILDELSQSPVETAEL